jgi:hypothetical protein
MSSTTGLKILRMKKHLLVPAVALKPIERTKFTPTGEETGKYKPMIT